MMRFEPNGPVSGHDQIKMATSIMDYVLRDLAINYLNRQDLANVKMTGEDMRGDSVKPYIKGSSHCSDLPASQQASGQDEIQDTKAKDYTGDECPECHSFSIVQRGTCRTCLSCGANSGGAANDRSPIPSPEPPFPIPPPVSIGPYQHGGRNISQEHCTLSSQP